MRTPIKTPLRAVVAAACLTLATGCGTLTDLTTTGDTTSTPLPWEGDEDTRRAGTVTVTRVVDGDTVDLADGSTVRMLGIDTPERGDCGYDEATAHLADLIEGERVRLQANPDDENTDQYGRLLRYIIVDGTDAGLAQIRGGYANARYDSRDGYGPHLREDAYIAADRNTGHICPHLD